MRHNEFMLAAMAEIGAMRKLLVHALALRLIEEPAPMEVLDFLGLQLTATPTAPSNTGGALDPVTSDYLAALTDEHTDSLVNDLRERVRTITG
ncbi:hypothetical protein DEA8626_02701 [Defluviimonas aquaemixtae]|uniref:Uncharacterized protein n=1 Tax=Albidovulum aquaemixtae TaxID=1542388 RepID=A0A2R8BJT2_9RHOB|nr:hypothetical protein [Defluviimonas aquaemixtae]SPH23635.1 hypothetical protein DEA8626_02701 [Defluviimonas aquaemixtae]